QLSDDIGQLTYKVWYFASLKYDEDQRNNAINARRQQVQILFAKANQASAWFNPELLKIPLATIQQWMSERSDLAVYRFAIEDLYRQQEHVLDDKGEHLLSLSSRFASAPNDAYAALSTADLKNPTVRLSTGADVVLTYGQYRAILATNRSQGDLTTASFRSWSRTRSLPGVRWPCGCRHLSRCSAPTTSGRYARHWRGGGSTSTRAPVSAAGRIRQPCTACIRTCCSLSATRSMPRS